MQPKQAALLSLYFLVFTSLFAAPAATQDLSSTILGGDALSLRSVQLIALLTVISLAPGIAIMVTCFPLIVTVLSILRQALGLQQSPPNMLITSLALFLTYFIMEPVFLMAWEQGLAPFFAEEIPIEESLAKSIQPFRIFMAARVDMQVLQSLGSLRPDFDPLDSADNANLSLLIPSFMLSEVSLAFQIGFLVFLPFLIIDLIVAAVLMSMGMMMVPPAIVSLPFKLGFFVIADGWNLLSTALVRSYF